MMLSVAGAAAECPDEPALILDGRVIRFAELSVRVERVRSWLSAALVPELAAPPPLAVVARADLPTLELVYAALELGIPLLLVHPRLTSPERQALLVAAQARALARPDWLGAELLGVAGKATHPAAGDERTLAVVYTSGSSGAPKGVELSRRAFLASARGSAANLGWHAGDRWLLSLPVAHIGGLSVVTRCLIARKALVLTQPERTPQGIELRSLVEIIERERVTLLSLVPTLLARLLELEPRWEPPAALRAILIGGAAAPPAVLRAAAQRRWPILTTYGLTEACSQVTTQPQGESGSGQPDSGRALPGVELRTLEGRIAVRGPTLLTRYYPSGQTPELLDGWFITGDRGALDAEGRLVVLGRSSDVIITGGENVWPAEVEAALLECSGIRQAHVYGVPDPVWGQRVAAVVVAPELDRRALAAELATRLASFKRPRLLAVLDALPQTPSGKPDPAAIAAAAQPRLEPLDASR